MTLHARTNLDLRRVSLPAHASLWKLWKQDGFWESNSPDRAAQIGVIDQLGQSAEPGILPHLAAGCAMHPQPEIRAAARRAIANLFSIVPLSQLRALDVLMRQALDGWELSGTSWSVLRADDVARFQEPTDIGVLALASMHRNGRVREAALIRLAARSTGEELPYLLLRLNDWVTPVRERARQVVSARLQPVFAEAFVRCIPLIEQTCKGQRGDHDWLMRSLEAVLVESSDALRAGCASDDREIRRLCLQIAVHANVPWLEVALHGALRDPDPILRLSAGKALLARANDLPALVNELLRDGFMPVRREALGALIEAKTGNSEAALIAALLDRHGSIREMARYHLRGIIDPAEHYRAAIRSLRGSRLAIAIRGLAESEGDASAIAPFIDAPEVCVRRAAISAVGRLDGRRYEEALFAALTHPAPGVSKEATVALTWRAPELDEARLRALLAHSSVLVRKHALRLVTGLPKWPQLRGLLIACRDRNESIAERAITAVGRWLSRYNRSFVIPTKEQVKNVFDELQETQDHISPSTSQELEALLRDFS
jgi:hypothetical protein